MDEKLMNTENSTVKISEDVVQTIAGMAIGEVEGFSLPATITDGFIEKLVKKNYGKGVQVEMNEKEVAIEVHVFADYGTKIQPAAEKLQELVKSNVENMTDLTVTKVDVVVDGITTVKEPKKKKNTEETEN